MLVPIRKVLGSVVALVLIALNICFFMFYALWRNADSEAISRMESGSAVQPEQLLENANLMWGAAQGSLLAIIALDALAIFFATKALTAFRRKAFADSNSASLST